MVVTFGKRGKVEIPIKSRVIEVKATDYPVNEYSMILAAEMMYVAKILEVQKKFNSNVGESYLVGHFITKKLLTECMNHRNRVAYLKRVFKDDVEIIGMYLKAYELYKEVSK